jgi:hypothetical protein
MSQVSNDNGIIRTFHASFSDYLTDMGRCLLQVQVQPMRHHGEIVLCLFGCMIRQLRRDICQIGLNTAAVDMEVRKAKYIGESLSYACQYWAEHLSHVSPTENGVEELLRQFVQKKLLCWMEVLSLLGKMVVIVTSLGKVRTWLSVRFKIILCYLDVQRSPVAGAAT